MGDYAKAEPLCRQALAIGKRVLGENHPDYAHSLNNLAMLYQAMGDYAKAEPLFRKRWRSGAAAGREPPRLRHKPEQPGDAVPGLGDYAKAEPLYRQALEIRKQALGENHPDYAASLNNLACCTRPWGTTPRPSRSTAGPWRSARRCWARTTPTMPPA